MTFGLDWTTSERRYDVVVDKDVAIELPEGHRLVGDIYRPVTDDRVPVIAGFHPYSNEFQVAPMRPEGFSLQRGWMESGDPYFFARRGYAHAIVNVRGTGKSSGLYQAMGPQESLDVVAAIAWLADQEWSTGSVGLFGISYFAWLQQQAAMHSPPALKAIFAPFAATDFYRDFFYHGGIFSYRFLLGWKDKIDGLRYESWFGAHHGPDAFNDAVRSALDDDDIAAIPELVAALRQPTGSNALVADIVLARFDDDWWAERRLSYSDTSVPAYLGACWGLHGLHLPGALRSWERWTGPKRLMIGPDAYLDRPLFQLHHTALRWFDQWLKGNDTGMMAEPPVELFVHETGRWRETTQWPLPETQWTPFYLQPGAGLSEHEPPSGGSASGFEDSPFIHGKSTFVTSEFVEETEVLGPAVFELFAATTDTDATFMVTVFVVGIDGTREVCKGWLRGSQAALDESQSRPWRPVHSHTSRVPLVPGATNRFLIELSGLCAIVAPGERLGVQIKLADDEAPPSPLRATGFGHIWRQNASLVTVFHNAQNASVLLVPITRGNKLGTFMSGGHMPAVPGPIPTAKIIRQKA